jgi:hypothetical protein
LEEQLIQPEVEVQSKEIDDEVMELKKIFYDFLEKEIDGNKQPLNYSPNYLLARCPESYF